ncbi:hypothetical protein PR048_008605 [Dryococelus australis]|uniref:Uncharacterized protein n=1 Tax=Dryococelus australis TaxID=614101 RepID=A0ABQ9HXK5_9NEOP|nr:hypothetical protein PR048_008605 [Dryococelus australis]
METVSDAGVRKQLPLSTNWQFLTFFSHSKNQTCGDEHRVFQERWELAYFCCESRGKITYLICSQSISVAKEYNLRRHYETHSHKYDEYQDKSREDKVRDLKTALGKQQSVLKNLKGDSEASVRASYAIAELIAKNCKCYTDSEFVKQCLMKTSEIACPGKVKNFRHISLSRNTISKRVDDIARNLNEQLLVKSESFVAFSIAVDESTDVSGEAAQVSVFIRTCDKDLNIIEVLLGIVLLQNTTTGEDLFEEVYCLLERFNLPLSKLQQMGAPSMTGKRNVFIARLLPKQKEVSPESKLHHIHCIIHQVLLCSKKVQMKHVLKYVKKVVNFIRSQGLNQHQFSGLLKDVRSEFEGLPCHAEVRWLSCFNVLKPFWLLREQIRLFLEIKCESVYQLCDDNWLQDLAFMVDMAGHLNDLNLRLQGKDQLVISMYDHIKDFKLKLNLWEGQLNGGNLIHFPTCQDFSKTHSASDFSQYTFNVKFKSRFEDFKMSENDFSLFSDPFSFDVQKADSNVRMELIDIQCNTIKKQCSEMCRSRNASNVWIYLSLRTVIFTYKGKQNLSIKTDNTFILHPENSIVTKSGSRH